MSQDDAPVNKSSLKIKLYILEVLKHLCPQWEPMGSELRVCDVVRVLQCRVGCVVMN